MTPVIGMRRQRRALVVLAVLCAGALWPCRARAEHWAERLGFGDIKVLILHADDGGMFAGTNSAIFSLLSEDEIQSASLMVPTAYYGEFVDDYNDLTNVLDVGVHLTLNSEWSNYRWGPSFSPPKSVKRILKHKFLCWGWRPVFPRTVATNFLCRAPRTMKREALAQVGIATAGGFGGGGSWVDAMDPPPSHIDTHQGGVFVRRSHYRRYLQVAIDTDIPVMTFENWEETRRCLGNLPDDSTEAKLVDFVALKLLSLRREQREFEAANGWPFPRLDQYCGIPYGVDLATSESNFKDLVSSLANGITQFMFHPSDEDALLRSSINPVRAERRIVIDREIFRMHGRTGPEWHDSVRKWLEDQGVEFTNWRKMMRRFEDPCVDPMDGAPHVPPASCS